MARQGSGIAAISSRPAASTAASPPAFFADGFAIFVAFFSAIKTPHIDEPP